MTRPLVGLLVVGKAPRPALLAEFTRVLGDRVELRMLGALDHLDDAGLEAARPTGDKDTLFTTLPDGRSILVSKAVVTRGMEQRLKDLQALGAKVSIVCCTGRFPLQAPGVHFASDLIAGATEGCLPTSSPSRLGVFIPSAAQSQACIDRWQSETRDCVCLPLSPAADDETVRQAAREMASLNPDLILHDCISYTKTSRDIAAAIHGKPALQAASVCAHFAAELAAV